MALRYRTVIFDLDGTLLKSEEGVLKALSHALEPLGISLPTRSEWAGFFGPPLAYSFMNLLGLSEEQSNEAVMRFREYYGRLGCYEACLYPGIKELLLDLKSSGAVICLATSKSPRMTEIVVDHFGLRPFMAYMAMNSDQDRKGCKKAIINKVRLESGSSLAETVMIGDSKFDAAGAAGNELPFIGVLYGYGSQEEMRLAGGVIFARDVEELRSILFI